MKAKKANLCGKQIKLARIDREMHQVELAAALSVDCGIELNQSMVSAIERGQRRVSDVELDVLWLECCESLSSGSYMAIRENLSVAHNIQS